MFTGLVQDQGRVRAVLSRREGMRLLIRSPLLIGRALGESIAVNGVCLTITSLTKSDAEFDVMAETIRKTTLGKLRQDARVNLEPALKSGDALGGHFVYGHVDCVSTIRRIERGPAGTVMTITVPTEFRKYIIDTGSVAVDGVSLTVAHTAKDAFSAGLIPHTLRNTTLGQSRIGDGVNVEFDMVIKAQRNGESNKSVDETLLRKYNYL